tara:strand:+ start:111279 stop:111617 length:339 start_codon:yes stop_codon:yes gene_type:complete
MSTRRRVKLQFFGGPIDGAELNRGKELPDQVVYLRELATPKPSLIRRVIYRILHRLQKQAPQVVVTFYVRERRSRRDGYVSIGSELMDRDEAAEKYCQMIYAPVQRDVQLHL